MYVCMYLIDTDCMYCIYAYLFYVSICLYVFMYERMNDSVAVYVCMYVFMYICMCKEYK
jgi:hypothetical protein